MSTTLRTLAVFALTAALALTGCVDTLNGEDGILGSSSTDTDENLAIHLTAENVPEDAGHLGLIFKDIFVHNAANASGEGYYELTVKTGHADLVTTNGSSSVQAAGGNVPAGTYDQVRIQLRDLDTGAATEAGASGNASGDGHAHADGGADDGHAHGEGSSAAEIPTDIPINLTFEVTEDDPTEVDIVIDVGASLEGDSFQPVISRAEVTVDGETETLDDVSVLTREEAGEISADAPDTAPPVARIDVFNPDGEKVYETDFQAESGAFVNSKESAYPIGETLRFSGSASEAVATGASIDTYTWEFGDGNTTTGTTVSHAYDQQGVFEVKLTATDTNGVSDDLRIHIVVLAKNWTATLAEEGFEEDAGEWTTESADDLTTWALDGSGHNGSAASWHVGHHLPGLTDAGVGYTSNAEATLTSPTYEVPADWTSAGFKFHIAGASEDGFDFLTVTYTVGGTTTEVGQWSSGGVGSGMGDWIEVGSLEALSQAPGEEVQFTFTFTSDGNSELGPGWYVDDFVIGGVDIPLKNAQLLEEAADDGHDHEH